MKRSYEFHKKINTEWNKKLSSEQYPCAVNTQNGIVPDTSQRLDCRHEELQSQTELVKSHLPEDSSTDLFRSRIALKLKSLSNGPASQLQGDQPPADFEKLMLQNFICSAKSQISGLLNREQKLGGVSKENSPPKTSLGSFNIDPLQIQISSKLQDLLCKALDERSLCKNVANTNSNSVEEAKWQDLQHLLQDFLSSAKKKISFSLTGDKPRVTSSVASRSACDTGNLVPDTDKKYCQINKVSKEASKTIVQSPTMECFDETDSSNSSPGGMLLLEDAERAPDYLDLSLEVEGDSDVDDPGFKDDVTDSDEEVVVLGEKKPTYQEITLDEEGEVSEKVVELQKKVRIPKDLEDLLYDCPKCDKKFRVESLLKFHVRMHSVVESHGRVPAPDASVSGQTEGASHKSKSRKEKENKLNSKSSRQHKIQKHSRRKVKMTS